MSPLFSLELKLTVLRPYKTPATNLEVDVSEELGRVNTGGHVATNASGVATFKIKPGKYYIFFNAINFHKNLAFNDTPLVTLEDGKAVEYTVKLIPN